MTRRLSAVTLAVLLPLSAGLSAALQPAAAEDKPAKGIIDQLSEFLRGTPKKQAGESPAPAAEPTQAAPDDERRVPFGRSEMQLSFAPLVKEAAPAVVNVYASQQVRVRSPFADDPFFERFFGGDQMPPRVQSALGSGVLVDASG